MEINLEKRKEMYLSSSPEIQKMYDSGGLELVATAKKIGIVDEDIYKKFTIAIGDIILGMYKKESLSQILKDRLQLSEEKVNTVVTDLSDLLARIPQNEPGTDTKPFVMPPLQTTNMAVQKLEPTHTFKSDMQGVHGYGVFLEKKEEEKADIPTISSFQDSLLKKEGSQTPPSTSGTE